MFQRLFGVWNGNINEVLHITFWPIFLLYSENSLLLWTTILLHRMRSRMCRDIDGILRRHKMLKKTQPRGKGRFPKRYYLRSSNFATLKPYRRCNATGACAWVYYIPKFSLCFYLLISVMWSCVYNISRRGQACVAYPWYGGNAKAWRTRVGTEKQTPTSFFYSKLFKNLRFQLNLGSIGGAKKELCHEKSIVFDCLLAAGWFSGS